MFCSSSAFSISLACFVLSPTPPTCPFVCCLRWPLGSALISFCPEHQSITSNPTCHLSPFPSLHCVTLSLQLVLHLSSHLSPHPPSLSVHTLLSYFPFPIFFLTFILRANTSYPISNFYLSNICLLYKWKCQLCVCLGGSGNLFDLYVALPSNLSDLLKDQHWEKMWAFADCFIHNTLLIVWISCRIGKLSISYELHLEIRLMRCEE